MVLTCLAPPRPRAPGQERATPYPTRVRDKGTLELIGNDAGNVLDCSPGL